jgi:hypothetical protein
LKYILHGVAFTVINGVIAVGWAILLAFLLIMGSFIGLIIGLFVLVLAIGYINTIITEYLWGVNMEEGWKVFLTHGIFLFIVLLVASIPQLVANYVVPGLLTSLVTMAIYIPLNGYLARGVSSSYEMGTREAPEPFSAEDW